MEQTAPLHEHGLNYGLRELNLSKSSKIKHENKPMKIKSFMGLDDGFFNEEDANPINIDDDNPFNRIWNDPSKKRQKYQEKFPKDDSFTDTNLDSTDTEPTDTDIVSTGESEFTLYRTTTDSADAAESIDPNTEAHRESSPSYHSSEDDSDESTDSEYFDSDAPTESSERSYTSLSENVDDSPDFSSTKEEQENEYPLVDGGPPKTFKWSEDEEMEIPVKKTGKTFDPYEEDKKRAREKLGPDFVACANPMESQRKWSFPLTRGVSNIVSEMSKHTAPGNSVGFRSGVLEKFSENRTIQISPAYRDNFRFSNSLAR